MTSAFGGQRSIQLSYGCLMPCGACIFTRGGALSKRLRRAPDNCAVSAAGSRLTNRQGRGPSLLAMATLPPESILPADGLTPSGQPDPAAMVESWAALHRDADSLAAMAGIARETDPAPLADLVNTARDWQLAFAAQGIADISAMLKPGLAALATLTARGQDAAAPALALWREFHSARASVLAVLDPARAA